MNKFLVERAAKMLKQSKTTSQSGNDYEITCNRQNPGSTFRRLSIDLLHEIAARFDKRTFHYPEELSCPLASHAATASTESPQAP